MFDTLFRSSSNSPFAGKPVTRQSTDKAGRPTFTVQVRALHPLMAKWNARLGYLAGFALGAGELYWLATELPRLEPIGWVLVAISPFVTPWLVRLALGEVLQTERVVKFTTEDVAVRTFTGWKTYPLELPIKLSLISHDRERLETETLTHFNRKWARRLWWLPMAKAYYNKSVHLSLDHFDQRNDLMTIYGRSKASRIAARLNACLEVVRNHGQAGAGTSFDAQDDWSRQPGGIIDLN